MLESFLILSFYNYTTIILQLRLSEIPAIRLIVMRSHPHIAQILRHRKINNSTVKSWFRVDYNIWIALNKFQITLD